MGTRVRDLLDNEAGMTTKKKNSDVTFVDLTTVTARMVAPALAEMSKAKLAATGKMMPLVVESCPASWGDPKSRTTWTKLSLRELGRVRAMLSEAVEALDKIEPDIELDLSDITPEEWDKMMTGTDRNNPKLIADLLATFVVRCPEEWGPPDVPNTYLDLPYYTVFVPCQDRLTTAGAEELENFLGA